MPSASPSLEDCFMKNCYYLASLMLIINPAEADMYCETNKLYLNGGLL